MPYKSKMRYEGSGGSGDEKRLPLQSWLKSTRRYLENTPADDTIIPIWSVMEFPTTVVMTDAQVRRNSAARDCLLSYLSPIMAAMVESKTLAADMWRTLTEVC